VVKVYSENFAKPGLSDTGWAQPDTLKYSPIIIIKMKFSLLAMELSSKVE
jgi:hypothetical protein